MQKLLFYGLIQKDFVYNLNVCSKNYIFFDNDIDIRIGWKISNWFKYIVFC